MSKTIKTIQSKDKVEFDNKVNYLLKHYGKILNNSYEIINDGKKVLYSQVIVFENVDIEFYENDKIQYCYPLDKDGKEHGIGYEYYSDGSKRQEYKLRHGIKELLIKFYNNGNKESEERWSNGKNDYSIWYYENGQRNQEVKYRDGEKIKDTVYFKDNRILYRGFYKNGKKWSGSFSGGEGWTSSFTIDIYYNGKYIEQIEGEHNWIWMIESGTIKFYENKMVEYEKIYDFETHKTYLKEKEYQNNETND
tara:strand:- start:137 stop:886 length:750 start_codon:yes stop_codon:yes gene_type:complete